MGTKIIISGNYIDKNDFDLIDTSDDLSFVVFPKLSELSDDDIENFHNESSDANLIIIALFGSDIRSIEKLKIHKLSAPKALWSFDSHHQWTYERIHQGLFDKIFISHSPYMKFFDADKVEWCPCCFVRFGVSWLQRWIMEDKNRKAARYDVVFPYKPYSIGSRNTFAAGIKRILQDLGVKHYLGPVDSGKPYMNLIQSSKSILNLSLMDDLNIRNFEAWALNRILLANVTPDHTLLDKMPNSTVFFKRDLSDIEPKLKKALDASEESVSSSEYVLNGHMQIHRYVHMINKTLGTAYSVSPIMGEYSD